MSMRNKLLPLRILKCDVRLSAGNQMNRPALGGRGNRRPVVSLHALKATFRYMYIQSTQIFTKLVSALLFTGLSTEVVSGVTGTKCTKRKSCPFPLRLSIVCDTSPHHVPRATTPYHQGLSLLAPQPGNSHRPSPFHPCIATETEIPSANLGIVPAARDRPK